MIARHDQRRRLVLFGLLAGFLTGLLVGLIACWLLWPTLPQRTYFWDAVEFFEGQKQEP